MSNTTELHPLNAPPERMVREYIQRGHIAQTESAVVQQIIQLVVAYCRVSTKQDQQQSSYEAQRAFYIKYIAQNPEWKFAGIYADEKTGTSARKRKNFTRMINDALAGKFNIIITKSVSRFARNTVDALVTIQQLRDKKVKVIFEKDGIDSDDPKCDLILKIMASLAEEESRNLSTNIRWRNDKKYESGEVIMNFNSLLGYEQKDGVVTIVEEEAEVIREIFYKVLMGLSFSAIKKDLIERGVQTSLGNLTWHKSLISSICQNEKYLGDAILRKTYQRDLMSPYRIKNTGQRPQRYVENNHPAIIDRETFDAVQAELKRRKSLTGGGGETGKSRYSSKYPLSGLIRCGTCGSVFRRHFYRTRVSRRPVWTCSTHIGKGKFVCPQKAIYETDLEELLTELLNVVIEDKNGVIDKVKEFLTDSGVDADDIAARAERTEARIKKLQDEMFSLNCKRAKKEITHEDYTEQSAVLMGKLDKLFVKRDDTAATRSTVFHNALTLGNFEKVLDEVKNLECLDQTTCALLLKSVLVKADNSVDFELKNGVVLTGRLPTRQVGTGLKIGGSIGASDEATE